MKTVYAILFVVLSQFHLSAQTIKEYKLTPEITSIIVYLQGAEVSRTQNLQLIKGRNNLIFEGLSPKINPKSIRFNVPPEHGEKISILSISKKTNYLSNIDEKPRVKLLKDSLEIINQLLTSLHDNADAYKAEKELLKENIEIGGENNGVPIVELKQAAEFYRTRIKEINQNLSTIKRKVITFEKRHKSLKKELTELNAELTYPRSEISILLSVEENVKTSLELRYLVNDAGWTPSYDIKAEDVNQPVQLIYRAKVYNNTQIDWNNVHITLSTADPNLSAAKPELTPWYLNSKQPGDLIISRNEGYMHNMLVPDQQLRTDAPISTGRVEYKEVEVTDLNANFDIKTDYTIPADDKPYLVDIIEYNLEATYKHFSVPKLDRDAFLLARITGWEDLNLVEGDANVYFAGTYIGQSYINTRNVRDTLDLSLGRDKKVLVTRSKLKDYSSTKFIGNKKKETLAYEMIVKNNRKATVSIEIRDQLPISQNSDITVDNIELSDAKIDEATGELRWLFNLSPGKSKKIRLTFSVKYPKNTAVQIKQTQKRAVRSF